MWHDFVDYIRANPLPLEACRITEADAEQFFAKLDKPPLTDEEIRKKIPREYYDLLYVARP